MKCFIATWAAILALAVVAAPALAMPADNGPKTTAGTDAARPARIKLDHGPAPIVYVVIGLGAVLTLTAAGYAGLRVVAHR
jgi:hypothetical protein